MRNLIRIVRKMASSSSGPAVVSTTEEIRERMSKFDLRLRDANFTKPEGFVSASVLVPLFIRDGKVQVLLTVRSKHLRSHAGLVAFPGGHMDEDDQSVISTALREAEEETGLPAKDVDVIAVLPPSFVRPNKFVSLVVGIIPSDFEPKMNEAEVSKIFSLPLERFLRDDVVKKDMVIGESEYMIFFFHDMVDGEKIETWGFTASYCMLVGLALCTSDYKLEMQKGVYLDRHSAFLVKANENHFKSLKKVFQSKV